jgi:hypothetical protein
MEGIEGRLIRSRSYSLDEDCGGSDADEEGVMRKEQFGVDRGPNEIELYGCQRTLERAAGGGLRARECETACIKMMEGKWETRGKAWIRSRSDRTRLIRFSTHRPRVKYK